MADLDLRNWLEGLCHLRDNDERIMPKNVKIAAVSHSYGENQTDKEPKVKP